MSYIKEAKAEKTKNSEKYGTVKGMSDERQNRPILSADKITRQKSVVCHAKIARFCRPR